VWDFVVGTRQRMPHHDVAPLPGGNVLSIVWERKTTEEAIRAGRRVELVADEGLWPDVILEIAPRPPSAGEIVWEWHVWDHLVQDHDPLAIQLRQRRLSPRARRHQRRPAPAEPHRTRRWSASVPSATCPAARPPPDPRADFLHTNSIAYNPSLDQIALSVSRLNELWVIDYGTTSAEAAGHSGGRAGRGGDLLYRWGNPRAYGRGSAKDQQLHGQHDVRWIPADCPGAGNLMAFDNGTDRPGLDHSRGHRDLPAPRPRRDVPALPNRAVRAGASCLDICGGRPARVLRRVPVGRPPPCPTGTPSSAPAPRASSSR